MKKLILFLMFVLAIQFGYKISPVLAQENKYAIEIKRTIEKFLEYCTRLNIDSTMQLISVNYSETTDKGIVDYAKYKSQLESVLNNMERTYVNYSFYDLEILKFNMQDNKATAEIRFKFRGFNIDTLQEDKVERSGIAVFAKENGIWKMINSKMMSRKMGQ